MISPHLITLPTAAASPQQNTDAVAAAVSKVPKLYRAVYDFKGDDEDDLSFKVGDVVAVMEEPEDPKSWWCVRVT